MRRAAIPLLLLTAGCCTQSLEAPPVTGTPSDMLVGADPDRVADGDLHVAVLDVEDHYWARAQHEGVCFAPWRNDPSLAEADGFGKGGDSALFTGQALAAWAFKASSSGGGDRLVAVERALWSLRGLWYVTNAAGPGVIARCAFPTPDAGRFGYPDRWAGRIAEHPEFVGATATQVEGPPLPGVLGVPFPPTTYYTRGTKDQLTGILLGLSVAWALLPEARDTVREIMKRLATHLEAHDWRIRDEKGENDTNADDVDGMLKLAFLGLWQHTSGSVDVKADYLHAFGAGGIGDWFNWTNNYTQDFAHNLRTTRAFCIWLLDADPNRRKVMSDYYLNNVWPHVRGHQNGWFNTLGAIFQLGVKREDAKRDALWSLKSLSLKPLRNWPSPYGGQDTEPSLGAHLLGCADRFVLPPHLRKPTGYSTWQKEPWDVGGPPSAGAKPAGDATGLGIMLPYWLGKHYSLW